MIGEVPTMNNNADSGSIKMRAMIERASRLRVVVAAAAAIFVYTA